MNAHLNSLLGELNRRRPDAHKGDCGRVMVVAGSAGMTGAAYLAGEGALRAGAGLVTLVVPEKLNPILEVKTTCVMTFPAPATGDGAFAPEAAEVLGELTTTCSVMVVGPGIGRRGPTAEFLAGLLAAAQSPVVLDADGLNIVASRPAVLEALAGCVPAVITPHPGEFARLLGTSTDDVQANRTDLASQFARRMNVVVVLKGYGTVVTDGKRQYVNATGNPGMATAGAGDVLSGMIGAFIGQGLDTYDAACLGVERHGRAGDIAADRRGVLGMTAADILDAVPDALKQARDE